MSGPRALGRISTSMIQKAGSPRVSAAATYSRVRRSRTRPRTMRMIPGPLANTIATTMLTADAPKCAMMRM